MAGGNYLRELLISFIGCLKHALNKRLDEIFPRRFWSPGILSTTTRKPTNWPKTPLARLPAALASKIFVSSSNRLPRAYHYERQITREEIVLIADIGGGTSDFSIVRLSPERARAADRRNDILANGGVHIGGTDFDRQLSLAGVMPHLAFAAR